MIITYTDSSALLRWVLAQGDLSAVLRALVAQPTASVIAKIEIPAAIHARFHRRESTLEERDALLERADQLLDTIGTLGLTVRVRRHTRVITAQYLLRSLDAIQVAAAVVLERQERRHGNVVRFCTADRRQAEVAEALFGAERVDFVPPWR